MGGSSYDDDHYTSRVDHRAKTGTPTFAYDASIKSGATRMATHAKLDPKGVTRESRDSDAHPESLAIAAVFDVTGSMASVPKTIQEKIPQLMGLLLRKGYVAHPQVLFGAVGDFTSDRCPLQIGQFESGIEMDDDITNLVLEGGGGGTYEESYQLALYFFARHTSIDCHEKRGRKGYLFLIGDEMPYRVVTPREAKEVFGDTIQAEIPVEALIAECREKYNVFFVIPKHTHHGSDVRLKSRWEELLGSQSVIMLEDETHISETIATAVGINEGTTDIDGVRRDLADVGATAGVADALVPLANAAALARVGDGNLPERIDNPGTNVRL